MSGRDHARELRSNQTKPERLLWGVLRSRQVCGLKFRRQHPIGRFIADFACVSHQLVIEIDGEYHDHTFESDSERESFLNEQGWTILRFSNEDVLDDPELLAMNVAKHLGLTYTFDRRAGTGSGNHSDSPSPQSRERDFDPPKGRVS